MDPRFQIRVVADDDFPELIESLWEAFENPYQGVLRLFFPVLDNDRQRSLQTCIANQLEEYHQEQPQLIWATVVDTHANDRIAAAAKWYFYDHDPHAQSEDHPLVADWYPEGVAREFATKAARLFERPREQLARRSHAFLHIAFTMPEYRRQGLGHLLMEWAIRKTDERGLEAWLDASEFGRPLYEKFGFRKVLVNPVQPVSDRVLTEEEKAEWEVCEKSLLPIVYTVMWRPPQGLYVEGQTPVPWKVEAM
ncbi:acyl-CoA N-acyltransferase [Aspergillus aurantiobrunneus]